jgi:hypothetical protein
MSSEVHRGSDETELLIAYLGSQRRHVLGILEGLDDDALRRPVLPSGWSPLTMVGHLTLDDERFWFAAVIAAEPEVVATALASDGWTVPPDLPTHAVLDGYREQARRSDEILRAADLDAPPAWWPDEIFDGWRLDSVREIVLHVLVETAAHAGHLDAARELIDGRQWMVQDG